MHTVKMVVYPLKFSPDCRTRYEGQVDFCSLKRYPSRLLVALVDSANLRMMMMPRQWWLGFGELYEGHPNHLSW